MSVNRFNIRVYMLLLDDPGARVLLSDEIIGGKHYTKFPGGGLEYGEGIAEGLQREALEELGQEITDLKHFYTTEFFQLSKFNPNDQIISVYYTCRLIEVPSFRLTTTPFDFQKFEEREESFRWKNIAELNADEMSFPIDKVVVKLLVS